MAASKARTLANRKNSRKSTGPKTAAGKARSSANSLKHGLTGEGLCLPVEDVREIDLRFDSLAEELCPITQKELFYTRRVAMLTLRVDRCYLKEAFNLRMAVRDAVTNHDKQILDEVRLILEHLPENPWHGVDRLKQSPQGIDLMLVQWRELRDTFAESGTFNRDELLRAEQLQGRRHDATGKSRIQDLVWKAETGLERVDGDCRTSPEQTEACKARSKVELTALLSRQIEDLLVIRAKLPLADIELNRQEAPMRALIDVTNAGQLLRRYESAAAREIHKIYDYFDEIQTVEAAEESDVTLDPTETSATLASFGSPPDPEPAEPVAEPVSKPEIEAKAASNRPVGPIAPDFEPSETLIMAVEGLLRE